MAKSSFIAMDVHCGFTEGGWINSQGVEQGSFRCKSAIPELVAELEKIPSPRMLVIEEGPLSDWLYRSLSGLVEKMVVCDAYRNALVAKEGDKDDPIDWRKLAALLRGGYVKAVHQCGSIERSLLKQRVHLHHDRVRNRVRQAQRVIWQFRRWGLMVKEKDFADDPDRKQLLAVLPQQPVLQQDLQLLLDGYDQALEQESTIRRRLKESARGQEQIQRLMALPGVGVVRAATFVAIVDTPFRFRSKQALWKYCGIGLERRRSGNGPTLLRLPRRFNRPLKGALLGAAKSAAAGSDSPFADQYRRWLDGGCSPRIARRNLARSLSAVMWGMLKSGNAYEPTAVGQAGAGQQLTVDTAAR